MTSGITLMLAASLLSIASFGQEIERELKAFNRIVISPRINVVLNKGARETVRLSYHNVSSHKINIEVTGRTLRIYLDHARKVERMKSDEDGDGRRESEYAGAEITAFVTYTSLEMLEIRGNQELTCDGPIEASRFTLRAYGENEITLASLKTPYFKATLYGENDLRIRKGRTIEQKYTLYGENKIDTRHLRSDYIVTSIFGEGSLKINSSEEVLINAFGEPQIFVDGGAHVSRRLVIGRPGIFEN